MAILSQIFDEYGLNAFIWIKTIIKNGILAIQIPDSLSDYRTLAKDKVQFLLYDPDDNHMFSEITVL